MLSKAPFQNGLKYGEECQYKNTTQKTGESDSASETPRINQMLKERDKEIELLKKAAAFFAGEID